MRNSYQDNERAKECLMAVNVCNIKTMVSSNKADLICMNSNSHLATITWTNDEDNTTFKIRSVGLAKNFEPVVVPLDCTSTHYLGKLEQKYHQISDAWGRIHPH